MKKYLIFAKEYIASHPALWIFGLLMPPLFTLTSRLLLAFINQQVVRFLEIKESQFSLIVQVIFAVLLGIITAEFLSYIFKCLFSQFKINTSNEVKTNLFQRILGARVGAIKKFDDGEIQTRYGQDCEAAVSFISNDIFDFVYPLVIGVGYCIALLIANIFVGLVIVFVLCIVTFLNFFFVKKFRRIERESLQKQSDFTEVTNAVLEGKISIRMLGVDKRMYQYLQEKSNHIYRVQLQRLILQLKEALTSSLLSNICGTLILPTACLLAAINFVELSNAIFIANLCGSLMGFTSSLAENIIKIGNNTIGVDRVDEFLKLEQENYNTKEISVEKDTPIIQTRDLTIKYDDRTVIENVKIRIDKGEFIVLIGKSGCGKSSILKALLQLIEYDGTIELFGIDTRDLDVTHLRNQISYVPEKNGVVSGSLSYNVVLNTEPDTEKVITALDNASLNEFTTDQILNQDVGENGSKLSGGQKQRVSIARSFYKDADILLMDEPTSALDAITEAEIIVHLNKLRKEGKTIVAVTHREVLMRAASRILLVDDKQVKENIDYDMAISYFADLASETV